MNFVRQSEIDMDLTFERDERECRLLFLAQRDGKTRLMQLIGDTTEKEINKRFRIVLFSGCLEFTDIELTEVEAEQPSSLLESKQIIDPDKIQAISLLSYEDKQEKKCVTFVVQFENCICTVQLNESRHWTIWSSEEKMVKRFLMHGYQDKVYFAERGNNRDLVFMLEQRKEKVVKTEVYSLQGSSIVSISYDNQVMPAKGVASQKQAFYVLDDKKRVFYVSAEERTQFTSTFVGNLPKHTDIRNF